MLTITYKDGSTTVHKCEHLHNSIEIVQAVSDEQGWNEFNGVNNPIVSIVWRDE